MDNQSGQYLPSHTFPNVIFSRHTTYLLELSHLKAQYSIYFRSIDNEDILIPTNYVICLFPQEPDLVGL